jgi:hypothetical protein
VFYVMCNLQGDTTFRDVPLLATSENNVSHRYVYEGADKSLA